MGRNLILLDNTPPRSVHTSAAIYIGRRSLHKAYLLSLNMNLPMKAYTPAATVTVRYTDGSQQVTELIPPVNFDSYYQDFAINTVAMPLTSAVPGHGQKQWRNIYRLQPRPDAPDHDRRALRPCKESGSHRVPQRGDRDLPRHRGRDPAGGIPGGK